MLMKLMLLAAATAAAVSATTGVATNTVSGNASSKNKKREAFPGEILELPEHRAVFMDDPTAKTYQMDYMYV